MKELDNIKSGIKKLFDTGAYIHVNISMTRPKLIVKNASVKIVGVYPHMFQVEETAGERPARYSLQYNAVLIGQVVIPELKI